MIYWCELPYMVIIHNLQICGIKGKFKSMHVLKVSYLSDQFKLDETFPLHLSSKGNSLKVISCFLEKIWKGKLTIGELT